VANEFENLSLPALNGAGAAVDTSLMGIPKTIEVVGSFRGTSIAVEVSEDGGSTFAPITVFQNNGGKVVLDVVADFMRVNVQGRKTSRAFSANCDVGAPAATPAFVSIPMPAANGAGAAVDISTLGDFVTIVVGGSFKGAVVSFEISEDGVDYAPLFSFAGQGGTKSALITASYIRSNVTGRKDVVAFSATADLGAVASGGGGSGGIDIDDDGVPLAGGPFDEIDFTGGGVVAADAGGGKATVTITGRVMALPEQWSQTLVPTNQTSVPLSQLVSQAFDTLKMIRSGSIVGIGWRILNGPCTAGTLTVEPTINGVVGALSGVTTNAANTTGGQATQAAGLQDFVAGDLVGVKITTIGFAPANTVTIEVWLEVVETL
jgi:hypothetical protein